MKFWIFTLHMFAPGPGILLANWDFGIVEEEKSRLDKEKEFSSESRVQ
jgi:hypothetical protein